MTGEEFSNILISGKQVGFINLDNEKRSSTSSLDKIHMIIGTDKRLIVVWKNTMKDNSLVTYKILSDIEKDLQHWRQMTEEETVLWLL